jgi:hypothetical protein
MINPNTKKKLRGVLIAAICGAVFFDAVGLANSWISTTIDPHSSHGWFVDLMFSFFQFACFILAAR